MAARAWRRRSVPVLVAGLLAALLVSSPADVGPLRAAPAAAAPAGGPVMLLAIDAEDGGVGGHGPIANYRQAVDSVLDEVSNGGSQGLLVIGGGKSATDHVTSFWNSVATGLDPGGADGTAGEPVTFVNGAAAISSQSFAGFEMVAVASSSPETSSGGLTAAENDALSARENDLATFVNGGGGLVGLTQRGFAVPFDYLAGLGAFEINPLDYSNINPTPDGTAVGVTDALDVCCWHEVFDTYPDWLTVLATEAESGTNRVAALGGRASALPGSLTAAETFGGLNRSHRYRPQADCGQPVNCATGNFWHTFVDLAVPSRGPDLVVERTYNSLDAGSDGLFGRGWSSSASMHLVEDPSGRVTVHQENGATAVFAPDGTGGYTSLPRVKATLSRDAAGFVLVRQEREQVRFDADGRVTAVEDLNGYTLGYAYDANGNLATMTDAAGRSLSFAHDTEGRVTSVTDPAGRVVSYGYDPAGDLVTVTDVGDGITSFTYDTDHRLLTMTDPRGGTVMNSYDTGSRVVEQTDEVGGTLGFAYTATGTTITNARGFVIDQQYTDGMLTSLTKGVGTAEEATWTYTYDPFTLGATEVTDPNGHTTEQVFDDSGNVVSVTDPLGRQTTFAYGPHNELTTATDPSGVTTSFTHDANANLLSVSRPLIGSGLAQTITYAYDDPTRPGDVTTITDPTGRPTQLAHDTDGNVVSVTNPAGETATLGYDAIGRRTSMVSPAGNAAGADPAEHTTTWTYDPFGAVTSVVDPTGASTTYSYDANGNLVSVSDPDGNVTGFTYDAADRRTSAQRPDGTTVATGFDEKGHVVSQTDAAGQATTYSYDPLDRLRSSTDPLNRTTTFGYDPAGNLIERVDPDAGRATFSYDAADQLVGIAYSDGTTPAVAYTYDGLGLRTTMSDGTGTTTYTWDSLGRLTGTVNGAGHRVGYDYDLAGRTTAITYPNGNTVTRSHDTAGRFSAVTDWLGNTTRFSYDADSNLTSTQLPNGTDAAYAFDPARRVTGIDHTGPAGPLAGFDYTRKASGLLSSAAVTGLAQPAETYTYTALDQLASVNDTGYGYDPADNLTAMAAATLTYDTANQLTARSDPAGTTAFGYDDRGNRIEATPPDGPAVAYTYDQANRLTGVASGTTGTDLAGGQNHSIAALPDGTVWAWGANGSGQLGDGTTTSSTTPVEVPGLSAVAVAAGASHNLALGTDGTVAAWGANPYGQLGDGTTTGRTSPTTVTGLGGAAGVAAGNYHSLAVTDDGSVWAWGYNGTGQLGNGTTTSATTPVQVQGLDDVVAVAAGGIPGWSGHSLALRGDGTVWAWGYNKAGQLGDGTKNHRASPVQVTGLTDVVAVAAAGDNGYALRADGTVWAWGDNSYDQLGNTGANKSSSVPVQAGIADVDTIAAGGTHVLARKTDGTVWAWGNNNTGQLGNGAAGPGNPKTTPTPVQAQGLTDVAALGAGYVHSLAATPDTLWAWGANSGGQLGNGTTTAATSPTPVTGLEPGQAAPAVQSAYTYDGDGLRASKTTAAGTEQFTWDTTGGLPLLAADGNASYLYGPDGLPIAHIGHDGTVRYYHHDQLGSTRLLTDQAGTVVGTTTYDAHGTVTESSGEQPVLGFAGEYTDTETGLVYLRARYYDPSTGQFLTRDPLVSLTREAYGYAGNNPTNWTDPTGLGCGVFSPGDCIDAVVEAVDDAGEFVVRNRHTIIDIATTAGAAYVCAQTAGLGCAAGMLITTNLGTAAHIGFDAAFDDSSRISAGEALFRGAFSSGSGAVCALSFGQGCITATGPNAGSTFLPGFLSRRLVAQQFSRLETGTLGGSLFILKQGLLEASFRNDC